MESMLFAVNSLMFLALSIVWSKDDTANVCVKILLVLAFIANGIQMMNASGYIVKVHT